VAFVLCFWCGVEAIVVIVVIVVSRNNHIHKQIKHFKRSPIRFVVCLLDRETNQGEKRKETKNKIAPPRKNI